MTHGPDSRPHDRNFAARTAALSASEVRALFAVASRPEVVSLAGGMPFVAALDRGVLSTAMERTLHDRGDSALQYGSGQGVPLLRELILDVMRLEGIEAEADDVVVTTGSQHALELLAKLFLDPGDVVLAEGPSYVTALVVFRSFQAEVEHVPMDDLGLIPEALSTHIEALTAAGRTPKFLYTVPTFSNPAGVTLSEQRRQEILAIAQRHGILVIEDNPYGLLYFDSPAPAALRSLDSDGVVYLGTFSKTFAPGLRVGWALAPADIRDKLILANEAAILSPSSFTQSIVTEYLLNSDWRAQVSTYRELYRERRNAMLDALGELLPAASWTVPNGGFYVWLTLPEQLDATSMLPRAVEKLVAYTPGTAFYADGSGRNNIRLSFSYPTPDFIREGIRRLAGVIDAERDRIQE